MYEYGSEPPTAQQLLDYFNVKVTSVRNSTGNSEPATVLPPAAAELDHFDENSIENVRNIIVSGTSKPCALDPVHITIAKQFRNCYHTCQLCATHLCNKVVCCPEGHRRAIITPRHRKT